MADKKLYCKNCDRETDQIDMGSDLPKNRYKCKKCGEYNHPKE